VAPAGLSPQQDLDNALDNIFNHPNMGPFVGKLLIQHLVKSNPSPAYVSRVAAAFYGGSGVPRGDMKNIITAILLDPEATANDEGGADQPADGHLQEPALFIPAFVRAFGGVMNDQNYFTFDLQQLGQDLFNAPSVFNYYSPGYTPAGFNLRGPEFQMDTPNNAIYRASRPRNLGRPGRFGFDLPSAAIAQATSRARHFFPRFAAFPLSLSSDYISARFNGLQRP